MSLEILSRVRSLASVPLKRKFLVVFIPLMLAGQTAYLQTTYTSTNVPAALSADGYTRHTASLGTTTAAMTITYDDGGSIQVPGVPTMSNIKMLVSASSTDFSAASFVQADTVNTIDKTVSFHPPVGSFYTLAMSTAADLAIVTNGPASALPGATITYKLEVTNTGPSDVANVVVKMPGLSNFTVTSITASGIQFSHSATPTSVPATYSAATDLQNTGLTIPNIAAFGSVAILITGTAGSTTNSTIDASATVTMPVGVTDLAPANNATTFSTTIFTPSTLSRYALDKTATLTDMGGSADPASANIDASGNYHFNLVYTLMSGDNPIAPFGTTLKIPVTFTTMSNKADGAVNAWRGGSVASNVIFVQPYVDQGDAGSVPLVPGVNLFDNLPYLNRKGTIIVPYPGSDNMFYDKSNSGVMVPLGVYNITMGALPATTDPNVSPVSSTTIVKGGGNATYGSAGPGLYGYTAAYGSHTLGVTTYTPGSSGSASAPADTLRPDAIYPVVYWGLAINNSTNYGKDRGLHIDDGMVTFSTPSALPLRLLSFTGRQQNNVNVLSWSTTMEENTQRFDIERSTDGNNFTAIGNVVAAGNSTTTRQYTYNDVTAGSDAFYRLRMVDIDGRFTYSPVIRLSANVQNISDVAIGNVYPVPFNDVLNAVITSSANQQAMVQLYSTNGSLVAQYVQPLVKGSNTYQLAGGQFASLAPGIYILSVKTDAGVITREVTKQ